MSFSEDYLNFVLGGFRSPFKKVAQSNLGSISILPDIIVIQDKQLSSSI